MASPVNTERTEENIKIMLAQPIKIAVRWVRNGHVYKVNGENKQQTEGGAIGLEMTGEIAGVFMLMVGQENELKI